ncbi:MAG: hypothetical protein E3J94_03060 [Desulfobacteraceae bacterium]|nr:MAG: hypothetical protein E3J94_03060 [Desulfobacteraceae bacterium]
MAFEIEKLKDIGFSEIDCEAVTTLEKALSSGHYPRGTFKPVGKPYLIDFSKVVKLYFEYLTEQLSVKPDRNCPSIKSIRKGICQLSDLLLGKDNLNNIKRSTNDA